MAAAHAHAAAHADHGGHGHGHGPAHGPMHYVKIWAILLVLMFISLAGTEIPVRMVMIMSAFGIAVVKAVIVCAYFMHLNIEKRYIWYVLCTMLLLVGLLFIAVRADINRPTGQNWFNDAALKHMEENKLPASTGEHGSGGHN